MLPIFPNLGSPGFGAEGSNLASFDTLKKPSLPQRLQFDGKSTIQAIVNNIKTAGQAAGDKD